MTEMAQRLRARRTRGSTRARTVDIGVDVSASAPIFLILRRMRAPLIT